MLFLHLLTSHLLWHFACVWDLGARTLSSLHLKHLVLTAISHCSAFHGTAVRTQELPFKGPEMFFSPSTRLFSEAECGFAWSI